MWEFARVGQPVSIITVTDRDLEDTGRQVVNITDGNQAGHLALDSVGGVHVVRLARQLDRQTVSQYQLTITAQDGGTPARTATATLRIRVDGELNQIYQSVSQSVSHTQHNLWGEVEGRFKKG